VHKFGKGLLQLAYGKTMKTQKKDTDSKKMKVHNEDSPVGPSAKLRKKHKV
jgi:hypothetical protein